MFTFLTIHSSLHVVMFSTVLYLLVLSRQLSHLGIGLHGNLTLSGDFVSLNHRVTLRQLLEPVPTGTVGMVPLVYLEFGTWPHRGGGYSGLVTPKDSVHISCRPTATTAFHTAIFVRDPNTVGR